MKEFNTEAFLKLTDKCKRCQQERTEGIMRYGYKHFSDIIKPIE
jgi:hypothetical protein